MVDIFLNSTFYFHKVLVKRHLVSQRLHEARKIKVGLSDYFHLLNLRVAISYCCLECSRKSNDPLLYRMTPTRAIPNSRFSLEYYQVVLCYRVCGPVVQCSRIPYFSII